MFSLYTLFGMAAPLPSNYQQQVNNAALTWLLIYILVVLVVWWLISLAARKSSTSTDVHHLESAGHPETAAVHAEAVATVASRAVEVHPPAPDDLIRLEGIGPKVNRLLRDAGITTFVQLAQTDMKTLNDILDANDLQFMDPSSWPQQASLAAEGKTKELQALQAKLKGGRRVEK